MLPFFNFVQLNKKNMHKAENSQKAPSLFQSFIPIIFLIILLSLNVIIWGDATLDGSNQIALLLAAAIGTIISFSLAFRPIFARKEYSFSALTFSLFLLKVPFTDVMPPLNK